MCLNTSNFSKVYTLQRGACTRRRGALRKCACISSRYDQALPLPDASAYHFLPARPPYTCTLSVEQERYVWAW
jgi:hypothetical protein